MRHSTQLVAALALFAPGCLFVRPPYDGQPYGVTIQGLIGIAEVEPNLAVEAPQGIVARPGDFTTPLFGGAVQKLFGEGRGGLGIEGGGTFGYDDDVAVVVTGSGTSAADRDTIVADVFGGLFAELPLGETRLYAGAGGVVQYVNVDLDFVEGSSLVLLDDSAFGLGTYARVGFEVPLSGNRVIGVAARWVDVDLDTNGPDVDFDGLQLTVTVSDRW